jgi:hypothetical protein
MGVSSLLSQILLFIFYSPSGAGRVEAGASGDFVIGSDQNCLALSRKHIVAVIELTLRGNSGQRERRWRVAMDRR